MTARERSPQRIVREGWDAVSLIYRPEMATSDAFGHAFESYRDWLDPLFLSLPEGSRVLDLGCGCGVPVSALLANRFSVTGVDVSEVQIRRARELVPRADFIRGDMTRIAFEPRAFQAVVAFYSLIHVPLRLQRPLLKRIREWLAPNGWLIVIAGHDAVEGVEENWLGSGATMYWSHADAQTYQKWLEELCFKVIDQSFIPEGAGGHELFRALAR